MKHSPKWDRRFLQLAELVASWSKDPSTQVGAVIVASDKRIVSVGFNGFPRGMSDNEGLYANRGVKYPRMVHAEINAILHARESLRPTTGAYGTESMTLYTWPVLPCDRCAPVVIQSGIGRVVSPTCPAQMLDRWGESLELSRQMFREARVHFNEGGAGWDPV